MKLCTLSCDSITGFRLYRFVAWMFPVASPPNSTVWKLIMLNRYSRSMFFSCAVSVSFCRAETRPLSVICLCPCVRLKWLMSMYFLFTCICVLSMFHVESSTVNFVGLMLIVVSLFPFWSCWKDVIAERFPV